MLLREYSIQGLIGLIIAVLPSLALANSGAQREFELVLLAKPDVAHGAGLFDTCAACHGPTGGGARDGSVPAIGGQHFKVVARQIVDYRHEKRSDERMEHFANTRHLKDAQEIADVAAYINMLSPAQDLSVAPAESALNGAQVYGRLCASCHGRNAEGDGMRAIPRLANQHYEYLLRQMHEVAEGLRPDYSPEHLLLFNRFDQAQFVAVAAYLARIGTGPP